MSRATPFEWELHQRLLAGSGAAAAELCEAYLGRLVRTLARPFPDVRDDTLRYDAAVDAILDYTDHPARYDDARRSLFSYLVMLACGDLLNALKKEQRRTVHNVAFDPVVHDRDDGNDQWEAVDAELDGPAAGDPARAEALRRVQALFPDGRDRRLVALMLDGVRSVTPYACILGVEGQELVEQRTIVNRHKDRLKRRLRRLGVKLRDEANQ